LATDSSKIIDVIIYYLEELPEIENFILMQPTSPIRELVDIKNLVDLEKIYKTNSVVTVVEHKKHPYLMYSITDDMKLKAFLKSNNSSNRQSYPSVYLLNGSLYLSSRSFVLEHKSLINENTIASIMPPDRSVDIDNMKDWQKAESIMIKRIN
jgi:CMP-N-acetylneuraminic acid synthetase